MKDLDLFGTKRRAAELNYAVLCAQIQEYNRLAREYGKLEKKLPEAPKMSALRAFLVRLDLFGVNKRHDKYVKEEAREAAMIERNHVSAQFEQERMERAEMLVQTGVAEFLNVIKTSHVEKKGWDFVVGNRFIVERANQKVYVSEYATDTNEKCVIITFPGAQWQIINNACKDRMRQEALELEDLQRKIGKERLKSVFSNIQNEKK